MLTEEAVGLLVCALCSLPPRDAAEESQWADLECLAAERGMSLRKVTSLGSNLASVTDLKELKLHTVYAVISEALKPLQLVGQAAQFKFESKLEPLPVIWQSL